MAITVGCPFENIGVGGCSLYQSSSHGRNNVMPWRPWSTGAGATTTATTRRRRSLRSRKPRPRQRKWNHQVGWGPWWEVIWSHKKAEKIISRYYRRKWWWRYMTKFNWNWSSWCIYLNHQSEQSWITTWIGWFVEADPAPLHFQRQGFSLNTVHLLIGNQKPTVWTFEVWFSSKLGYPPKIVMLSSFSPWNCDVLHAPWKPELGPCRRGGAFLSLQLVGMVCWMPEGHGHI